MPSAAWAISWSRSVHVDPFDGVRNITVVGVNRGGGGIVAKCHRGKFSVGLILGPAAGNEGTMVAMLDSTVPTKYRIRIDQLRVWYGMTRSDRVEQQTRYLALPVESERLKAFVAALAAGNRMIYQFNPPDGRTYHVSLSGTRLFVSKTMDACLRQQSAQSASSATPQRGERQGQQAPGVEGAGVCSANHASAAQRLAYAKQVAAKIERNWLQPPGLKKPVDCKVRVTQSHYGEVLGIRLLSDCGSVATDLTVKEAVRRAAPLPTSGGCVPFVRHVVIDFRARP